jgi:hypothetical protein
VNPVLSRPALSGLGRRSPLATGDFSPELIHCHPQQGIQGIVGDARLRVGVVLINFLHRTSRSLPIHHTSHAQPPTEEVTERILNQTPFLLLLDFAPMELMGKAQQDDVLLNTDWFAGSHQCL